MKTTTVLRKAAEIILTPGRWTQGTFARDAAGSRIADPRSKEAQSFCVLGAIYRVDGTDPYMYFYRPTSVVAVRAWSRITDCVSSLNDHSDTTAEDMGTYLLLVAEAEKTGSRP